jgi:transposase
LIWDNAPWHVVSEEVRSRIKEHNKKVKKGETVEGVRIISCFLPTKSPWLNAIEPGSGFMASGGSWKPIGCSRRMS